MPSQAATTDDGFERVVDARGRALTRRVEAVLPTRGIANYPAEEAS